MQLGLALSGGGFRATLFHLGVVKSLLDRRLLGDVKHITSVSGGSILAAHLVQNWGDYSDPATFEKPARRIIEFARSDIRGRIFRRLLLPHYFALPYVENLRQWRLRRDGTVRNILFERDLRTLFGDVLLKDLGAKHLTTPRLDILATNLNKGELAYFSNGNFVPNDETPEEIGTLITVARAVMISSLFPAVFPTIELNAENLMVDPEKFASAQYFTDGGVFDNLGIRRFQTILSQSDGAFEQILVSDASGAFDWLVGSETLGQWTTAMRSSEVFMKRLADLEYEAAGGDESDQFKFLRISDVARGGALPESVQEQVKHIRTDLDRFSIPEIRAVILHGYGIAARATEGWTDVAPEKMVPWDPFPDAKKEPERSAVKRLRRSRFHAWGFFNPRDWASYVIPTVLLIALALGVDWYRGGRLHWQYMRQAVVSGGILDSVAEPEKAAMLVERAVRRPHRNQEYRLEATLLAYSLFLQQKDAASKNAFDAARRTLSKEYLARFHEAKWQHFYSTLPNTTFGFPDVPDTKSALEYIADAVTNLPADSPLYIQVAVTSYGIYSKPRQEANLKNRAFDMVESALSHFMEKDLKGLKDVDRFRAALLRGHRFLSLGNKAQAEGDALIGEQDRPQAASKYKEAEENFQKAAETYEAARRLRPPDLWKVDFNMCNAAIGSASATNSYITSREPLQEGEKQLLKGVVAQNLAAAEKSCEMANNLRPPAGSNVWQPTFGLAISALRRGEFQKAATRFVRGHSIAGGERDKYVSFLVRIKEEATPLCSFREFGATFVSLCR